MENHNTHGLLIPTKILQRIMSGHCLQH